MTLKTFLDHAKRIGTALGAWLWLIKILLGALGVSMLLVSVNGWRINHTALAKLTEEHTKLKGEVIAHDATARQLHAEKTEILASSAALTARYRELEQKVGKLTVLATMNVSSPVGGATAHGAPREGEKPVEKPTVEIVNVPTAVDRPVLLRQGDKGHIGAKALSLETVAGNEVLLLEGNCYRDAPGPVGTLILNDVAKLDGSEVRRLMPLGNPGVGIGPLIAGGRGLGLVYGALVSPATLNFKLVWNFQAELLLGAAANAQGDWLGMSGALLRVR